MTEQLKALAEAAKGWNVNHAMPETDGEPIDVGQILDGEFYPVITVDCGQYDQLSKPLAEYICYATPQRILALIAENEAHSRKDAEPVAYQYRMKPEWHDAWVKWQPCDKANFDDYVKAPVINGWQFDARALFTHPPDADKLLQQALEALEYRLQQTRPIHQADSVMEAIRTYLENKNA